MIIDPAKSIIKMSSLNKGLVGHWPLDRESLQSATTFADKTPRENTGQKYGSVLKFDGGDYVDCGTDASLRILGDRTLSAWVKVDAITYPNPGTNWHIMTNEVYQNYGFVWRVEGTSSLILFRTSQAGGGTNRCSSTVLEKDIWNHLSVVISSGQLTFYLNGVADGSGSMPDQVPSLMSFRISQSTQSMDGSIGETRIYSRALTAAEVLTMYQGGVVSDTDLEAHYKFGDKSGTVLTDETGTNNGTLTNFADTTAAYGNTHDSGWVTDDTPNVFALDRMGQVGRSLALDGESDYLNCGNDESLNSEVTERSISFWAKTNSVSTNNIIISNDFIVSASGIRVGYISNDFRAYWYDSVTGLQYISANTNPTIGEWFHCSYVLGNGTAKMYINNVLQSDTNAFNGITNGVLITYLGVLDGNIQHFDGTIADVRIYNRALDQTEITMLYDMYRPKLVLSH